MVPDGVNAALAAAMVMPDPSGWSVTSYYAAVP
jgi:hypothetical protein